MTSASPFAIVDIGSNSIRLVIFKGPTRHPVKWLDDSEMCRLGETEHDGSFKAAHMAHAVSSITRFVTICEQLNIKKVFLLATAAVRNATNREAFLKEVRTLTGQSITILTGEEEAHLAAQGVLSAIGSLANGVVADLGGSSLELIRLDKGRLCEKMSLQLGPLCLQAFDSLPERQLFVDKSLQAALPLYKRQPDTLYLVGGATRAIAKVHIEKTGYPIEIIHGYEMSYPKALEHLEWVQQQSPLALKSFSTRVKKRRHLLPLAAYALCELLKRVKPKTLLFSGYGLREGFAYSQLSEAESKKDLLLTSCQTLIQADGKFSQDAGAMAEWMKPILHHLGFSSAQDHRLVEAVCSLSDCGWVAFQEYRAEYVLKKILHSPGLMCTHYERFFIALALFLRYDGSPAKESVARTLVKSLAKRDVFFAEALALLLQCYFTLLDGAPNTWEFFPYTLQKNMVTLALPTGIVPLDRLKPIIKAFHKHFNLQLTCVEK